MLDDRVVYVLDNDSLERRQIGKALGEAGFTPRPYLGQRNFLDDTAYLPPGCVLLDMDSDEDESLGVLLTLGERLAQFPVVAMTSRTHVATAVRAMRFGASDVVEKPLHADLLVEALDRIFGTLEQRVQARNQRAAARARLEQLSPRERDVLRGLIAGLSNKAIAFRLGLSVRTVETYRANMFERLGARTFSDALLLVFHAESDNLLRLEDFGRDSGHTPNS